MKKAEFLNRRRFLGTATTAAGGMLLSAPGILTAGCKTIPEGISSTDHFWYYKPPDSPYIDSQRGKKAFAFSEDSIFLSKDNSNSWSDSVAFPDARNITFSHIFKNGNILFATREKLYLSSDKLRSYREIIVKNPDGTDFIPHTPQNPENPGWYFHTLTGMDSWMIGGEEMLVWGNYCNVEGGGTPVSIYYSTDNGENVKIAYAFGQNPYFRDNGSGGGGATGALLGNPDNPVILYPYLFYGQVIKNFATESVQPFEERLRYCAASTYRIAEAGFIEHPGKRPNKFTGRSFLVGQGKVELGKTIYEKMNLVIICIAGNIFHKRDVIIFFYIFS